MEVHADPVERRAGAGRGDDDDQLQFALAAFGSRCASPGTRYNRPRHKEAPCRLRVDGRSVGSRSCGTLRRHDRARASAGPHRRHTADNRDGRHIHCPIGLVHRCAGPATILEAPEHDSHIALVDIEKAADADAAVKAAWVAYRPDATWPLKVATPMADEDGWQNQRRTATRHRRTSGAASGRRPRSTRRSGRSSLSTCRGPPPKSGAQVALIFSRLLPKGYHRETFAARPARPLDAARIADLSAFVERARDQLGVPGVAIGLVQNGKVVPRPASACATWESRRRSTPTPSS